MRRNNKKMAVCSAAVVAAMTAGMVPALADRGESPEEQTICHVSPGNGREHTLTLSERGAERHLDNHVADYDGPCDGSTEPPGGGGGECELNIDVAALVSLTDVEVSVLLGAISDIVADATVIVDADVMATVQGLLAGHVTADVLAALDVDVLARLTDVIADLQVRATAGLLTIVDIDGAVCVILDILADARIVVDATLRIAVRTVLGALVQVRGVAVVALGRVDAAVDLVAALRATALVQVEDLLDEVVLVASTTVDASVRATAGLTLSGVGSLGSMLTSVLMADADAVIGGMVGLF